MYSRNCYGTTTILTYTLNFYGSLSKRSLVNHWGNVDVFHLLWWIRSNCLIRIPKTWHFLLNSGKFRITEICTCTTWYSNGQSNLNREVKLNEWLWTLKQSDCRTLFTRIPLISCNRKGQISREAETFTIFFRLKDVNYAKRSISQAVEVRWYLLLTP